MLKLISASLKPLTKMAFAAEIPGWRYQLQRKYQRSTTELYATAVWIRWILRLAFLNKALHFVFTKHSCKGIGLCKLLEIPHFLGPLLYVYLPDEFL